MKEKKLIERLGVKDIMISHINSIEYKDHFTIIINDNLAIDYLGHTISYIPLTKDGINKCIATKVAKTIINQIKEEFKDERI